MKVYFKDALDTLWIRGVSKWIPYPREYPRNPNTAQTKGYRLDTRIQDRIHRYAWIHLPTYTVGGVVSKPIQTGEIEQKLGHPLSQ